MPAPAVWAAVAFLGVGVGVPFVFNRGLLPMVPGSWYRLTGRLPLGGGAPSFASAGDLGTWLVTNTGFDAVGTLTLDGQGNFVVVAHWDGPGAVIVPTLSGVLLIEAATIEQIPPQAADTSGLLDAGIWKADAHAVAFALVHEGNADNLASFGQSHLPDYPIAASYLLSMANSRRQALKYGNPNATSSPFLLTELALSARQAKSVAAESALPGGKTSPFSIASVSGHGFQVSGLRSGPASRHLTPDTFRVGFLEDIIYIPIISDIANDIGVAVNWAYDNLGQFGILIPVVWEGVTAERALKDAAAGKSLEEIWNTDFAKQVTNLGHAMRLAAGIVSFFPGIGTLAGVLLNVAAGIALGEDMSDLVVDAVAGAIPGGGLVQTAFVLVAHACVALAEGKVVGEAFRLALRDVVVQYGGELGGVAYDTAFRLAQGETAGQALIDTGHELVVMYAGQEAAVGYDAVVHLAEGQKLDQAAIDAVRKLVLEHGGQDAATAYDAAVEVAQGKSVEDVAIDTARRLVGPPPAGYGSDDARRGFDLAVAVGQGKGLQESGFRDVYALLAGDDAAARARDFMLVYRQAQAVRAGAESLFTLPTGAQTVVRTNNGSVHDVLLERIADVAQDIDHGTTTYGQSGGGSALDYITRPIISAILSDTETDPLKQLANLTIPDLADALVNQGYFRSVDLTFPLNRAQVYLARSCISQITVTEGGAPVDPQMGIAAKVGDSAAQSVAVVQKTRSVAVINHEVYTRVFIRELVDVPAGAIADVSQDPVSIWGMFMAKRSLGWDQLARTSTTGSSAIGGADPSIYPGADRTIALVRARAMELRNKWINYYVHDEEHASLTIASGQVNPAGILASMGAASEDRKTAMIHGSPPANSEEAVWYSVTFGGPYGDATADKNRRDLCLQVSLDQTNC
jgi:hypothetical protein